jgi:uncharacterized SAM-binding protein YcdF (DUF218 family)
MELGALKPLLTSLAMPLVSLLVLALLGLLLAWRNHKKTGLALATGAVLLLGLFSSHGAAAWLAHHALPQVAPLNMATLKASRVQAIVILGGGVLPEAPEYGSSQLNDATVARLRYGAWLARQSGLPTAFSGGVSWAVHSTQSVSEAEVAARVMQQEYGMTLRWNESESRDTAGNARLLAPLLRQGGVQRIALVTHAWHMPRAAAAFEKAGLAVTPAPMGYVLAGPGLLAWLPSPGGLQASHLVLKEWLALALGRFVAV